MLYFFRRADATMSCETRLNPDGPGYQLVIVENGVSRVEEFDALPALLAREHELHLEWRTQGWRDIGQRRTAIDPWPGPN